MGERVKSEGNGFINKKIMLVQGHEPNTKSVAFAKPDHEKH